MNQFPGICRDCRSPVPARGGNYHRKERGVWTVRCRACINACNADRAAGKFVTYEDWRTARAASPQNGEPQ